MSDEEKPRTAKLPYKYFPKVGQVCSSLGAIEEHSSDEEGTKRDESVRCLNVRPRRHIVPVIRYMEPAPSTSRVQFLDEAAGGSDIALTRRSGGSRREIKQRGPPKKGEDKEKEEGERRRTPSPRALGPKESKTDIRKKKSD